MFKYSFEVYWWLLFAYFFMSEQISAFTISHLIERKLYKKRPPHQICIYSNKIISLLASKQEVWIFYVCLFSLWKSEWSSEIEWSIIWNEISNIYAFFLFFYLTSCGFIARKPWKSGLAYWKRLQKDFKRLLMQE